MLNLNNLQEKLDKVLESETKESLTKWLANKRLNTMILTGQCKEDFDKWYEKTYDETYHIYYTNWSEFPFSFQYGILIDFFDSVGVYIDDYPSVTFTDKVTLKFRLHGFAYDISIDCKNYESEDFKTRQEARKAAIEKANEIYNEKSISNNS